MKTVFWDKKNKKVHEGISKQEARLLKFWCVVCCGYLFAVTPQTCNIQESNKSAARFVWLPSKLEMEKTALLKWQFSFWKLYGRKLKQSQEMSKLTQVNRPVRKFGRIIEECNQKMSINFCLTVPKKESRPFFIFGCLGCSWKFLLLPISRALNIWWTIVVCVLDKKFLKSFCPSEKIREGTCLLFPKVSGIKLCLMGVSPFL